MSNLIVPTIAYFASPESGRPVSLGYVYMGETDTDPEIVGNQKTVTALQEDGSQVAISQPIRLNAGGQPEYNGSPVSLYVSGDYSLKVLDSSMAQKYYIPNNYISGGELIRSFDDVAEMKAATLNVGDTYTTRGYYSPGDGGAATYFIKTSAQFGGTPDELGNHTVNTDDVAVLQSSGNINMKWFGAVGDGTTDDTPSFTAIGSVYPGVFVDLLEGVYAVSEIPENCKFFNGDFVLPSSRVSLRRNRIDHPFDGNQWIGYGNGESHYWLFGMAYETTTDRLIVFMQPSWRHAQSYSTPLNIVYSEDKGQTFEGEKTIHSENEWDIGDVCAAEMDSGRTGALVALRDYRERIISGITQANPGVVTTTTDHGFSTGEFVSFSDVSGMTEVNGNTYTITVLSTTTFSIDDTSGFTAYTSGGLATATNNYRIDFVYSDNNAEDWSVSTSVVPSPNGVMLYGLLHPYPSSAGGSDTGGYVGYGYFGSSTKAIYTIDNGNSWNYTTINSDSLQEMSVVRIPGEDKWIGFYRKTGDNMLISTSTDMLNWTTPVDTGIPLGNNPVYAVVEGGQVYAYLTIRDFGAEPSMGDQNDVVCIEDNAEAVFASSDFTNASYRQVITGTERCLGYFKHLKIGQDFVFGYTSGEYDGSTNNAADSYITMGTTKRAPVASPGLVKQMKRGKNLLRNPIFMHWSRGTSFTGITTATNVADGWNVFPSGSTIDVTRTTISAETSRLLPFSGRYAMSITATADDFITFRQYFRGELELFRFADNNVTVQVWGFGDVPDGFNSQIVFDYGTGGSTNDSTTVNFKVAAGPNKTWVGTATVPTPTIVDKTLGTDPLLYIGIAASGNAAWDARILGVKAEFGNYASTFGPVDLEEDKAECERFIQTIDFDGFDPLTDGFAVNVGSFWGVLHFPKMIDKPTISFVDGAATDLEAYPTLSAITSITFNEVSKDRCSVRALTTGLVSNNPGMLRVQSGGTVSLLLDTE